MKQKLLSNVFIIIAFYFFLMGCNVDNSNEETSKNGVDTSNIEQKNKENDNNADKISDKSADIDQKNKENDNNADKISDKSTNIEQKKYDIVISNDDIIPGNIDETKMKELPENIRGIAAFYAALGGTDCNGTNCELTTALGLGKQGSKAHKEIIKKYFPGDELANIVVEQNCYLPPSGASNFSDFDYLNIEICGDTVKINYNLIVYSPAVAKNVEGQDLYLFKNKIFKKIKRNIWE